MDDRLKELTRQEWIDAAMYQKTLIELNYKQKSQDTLPFIRIIFTGIWIGALIVMPVPLDPWKYVRLSVLALMAWFIFEKSWLIGRAFFWAMFEVYFQDRLEKDAARYVNLVEEFTQRLNKLDSN